MSKEELIRKWLDNELSAEELLQFQQLEEYDSYTKISKKANLFKAPNFDKNDAYEKISGEISKKRNRRIKLNSIRPYLQIAAVFIIGIVIYSVYFNSINIQIETLAAQQSTVNLPDASEVQLNASSTLSYNKKTWSKDRKVALNGEAFFIVEKGSKFDVQTTEGIVSVVGTQFSVKNRKGYFEVKCFEGEVKVLYNNQIIALPAGKTVKMFNKNIYQSTTHLEYPTWLDNLSSFESVPLFEVIAELERQYDIKVIINSNLDTKGLYSGIFVHTDKEKAIQAIAVPFGLDYSIKNNVVTLKKVD